VNKQFITSRLVPPYQDIGVGCACCSLGLSCAHIIKIEPVR